MAWASKCNLEEAIFYSMASGAWAFLTSLGANIVHSDKSEIQRERERLAIDTMKHLGVAWEETKKRDQREW